MTGNIMTPCGWIKWEVVYPLPLQAKGMKWEEGGGINVEIKTRASQIKFDILWSNEAS